MKLVACVTEMGFCLHLRRDDGVRRKTPGELNCHAAMLCHPPEGIEGNDVDDEPPLEPRFGYKNGHRWCGTCLAEWNRILIKQQR